MRCHFSDQASDRWAQELDGRELLHVTAPLPPLAPTEAGMGPAWVLAQGGWPPIPRHPRGMVTPRPMLDAHGEATPEKGTRPATALRESVYTMWSVDRFWVCRGPRECGWDRSRGRAGPMGMVPLALR